MRLNYSYFETKQKNGFRCKRCNLENEFSLNMLAIKFNIPNIHW